MPDRVRYSGFVGLDNSNDPIKSAVGEGLIKLTKADNVNITRTRSVERRDGMSLWLTGGDYTSLWGNGEVCYGVKSGNLVEIFSNASTNTILRDVGTSPMQFVDARNGFVYYNNGLNSKGKIKNSVAYALNRGTDQFKEVLPYGNILSFVSPWVMVASKNVLYISDTINRDVYHQHMGFIQFDTDIRMIAPIGQSFFLSDSKFTYFVERMQSSQIDLPIPKFKLKKVSHYPASPGNPVKFMQGIRTELNYYPDAAMWVSELGICLGGEAGVFENLTEKKYEMPEQVESSAVEFRQIGDKNLFIASIKGV